jgi:hypothetical protein
MTTNEAIMTDNMLILCNSSSLGFPRPVYRVLMPSDLSNCGALDLSSTSGIICIRIEQSIWGKYAALLPHFLVYQGSFSLVSQSSQLRKPCFRDSPYIDATYMRSKTQCIGILPFRSPLAASSLVMDSPFKMWYVLDMWRVCYCSFRNVVCVR